MVRQVAAVGWWRAYPCRSILGQSHSQHSMIGFVSNLFNMLKIISSPWWTHGVLQLNQAHVFILATNSAYTSCVDRILGNHFITIICIHVTEVLSEL